MNVEGENIESFNKMKLDFGNKFLLTFKAGILKFIENG